MSITFAQENTCIEKDSYQRLSRFRLSLGYVDLLSNYDEFRYPFINLSYRSSGFDRSSYNVKVDLAFELGINTLIITYKHSDDYNVYFLPYAKFGPRNQIIQEFIYSWLCRVSLSYL
ncbi:MAG: hypothetical protein M5T52_08620 [Ignavibacteriaceae bacterium]|nr:hypothetical protein [Ignavibacteriaceae bacterium]